MEILPVNKRKIINDPVYGFLSYPFDLVYDLIEHPYFQRLRRIKQLGLTNFVYPGTNHTRFQHALGAAYLMNSAIQIIRSKGHIITDQEAEAVSIAILLHDIGHGPFSHALENSIIEGITHEELSLIFMEKLNIQYNNRLDLAIKIFTGNYHKDFLYRLVTGQLDMDRLDYLRRDSFFSGVTEGVIGSDRIIKMLNVHDDQLVVDVKGIYSIEKFLIARRLMYWQVYFHKTVISAEMLLVKILKRAKELSLKGELLFGTPSLKYFLEKKVNRASFTRDDKYSILELFSNLDDNDIISAAKVWSDHKDTVLSYLCKSLINRRLYKVEISNSPFPNEKLDELKKQILRNINITPEETDYLLIHEKISNFAYNSYDESIKIKQKTGEILDIAEASDMLNVSVLSKTVEKYFLCYPKNMG